MANGVGNGFKAAGQVASDIVSGLKASPIILAVIVLNLMGIGAATWFLHRLLEISHERYNELMKHCFSVGG